MHLRSAPSKSSVHRFVCRALYRALLRQCDRFPTPKTSSDGPTKSYGLHSTLRSLVRHRFEQDKKLRAGECIRDALHFGRGALQLLENAAQGSPSALVEMTQILSKSLSMAVQRSEVSRNLAIERNKRGSMPAKLAKRKEEELYRADKSNYQRKPGTVPVLDRPAPYDQALKHKDGRRRVPEYVVVQGIPFLRYLKKQPLALTQLITWRIKEHERSWDTTSKLDHMIDLAITEDEWDRSLVKTQHASPSGPPGDTIDTADSWATVHAQILADDQEKNKRKRIKRTQHSRKLFDIYLKEKALAKIENAARAAKREEGELLPVMAESKKHGARDFADAPISTEDEPEYGATFRPFS